jgi:uncharacterized protein (DUF58 family)
MKGERRSKQRGYSSEFADYRNYVEGDDLRHIDWNIYGRLDKLFLKLFLEEEDLHVHVLVDTSLSMGFGEPQKLGYAKKVAAAIAYIGLSNMDRVQVHSFANGLSGGTGAMRGKRSSRALFDYLENLGANGKTSLDDTCKSFAMSSSIGKGVVVLISDFLDPEGYEEALKKVIGAKMDVYVVHLLSPEEVAPELKGDLKLVDAEDGFAQEITVSQPLLKQYHETLKNFCGGIQEYCTKRGASYIFSSTDRPFDQLVLNYLRRGGLLS